MTEDSRAPAGRHVTDAALALLQVLLEAVLFAALVAALVFFLPGAFSVTVLSLYGFICVWLLQAAAVLVLIMMTARALISNAAGRDTGKAIVLCGGFLIAVALCNAYILMLGHLWGKDFAMTVDDIALSRFVTADQHIIAIASAALAVLGDFLDHLAVAVFHLHQPPLANFFTAVAARIAHAVPALSSALERAALLGFTAGFVFAVWRRLANGFEQQD